MKKILITLVIIFTGNQIIAQDYKFGKVSKAELEEKFYPQDSTANAVYLYKNRNIYYEYDGERGWTLITEVHERIKLYNKEGFGYATERINLYEDSSSEKMSSLKANTYNLENGKIIKEKLSKSQVFKEKETESTIAYKFTMPSLKEGSIVEWVYKIYSPYYLYIDEIYLQHKIPIKYINIEVKIPEYFNFKRHFKGYLPINVVKRMKNRTIQFSYRSQVDSKRITSERQTQKVNLQEYVYSVTNKNVPALVNENYVNNVNNYRSTLPLELSYTKFPGSPSKKYSTTWEDVCKKIYKMADFGVELNKNNYFKDDLSLVLKKSNNNLERVNLIFQLVKSKVKWNGNYGKYIDLGVKKSYKEGVGNVADINLMLISMLREGGLNANPVLVSTKNHGISLFPTSKGFNYVIAAVEINEKIILLDATEEYTIPNVLPFRAINWKGRIVKENGSSDWVSLISSKPIVENTIMSIIIDEEGFIEGQKRTSYTGSNALSYRNSYSKLKDEIIIEKLEEKNEAIEVGDFKINNKNEIYKPILEMYKFSSEDLVDVVGDKMYFNSLLYNAKIKNPFKLEQRKYPIDFGEPFVEKNAIKFVIPKGYSIESIPESIAIGLPNNYGVYKFNISASGNIISVYSILKMNTATYPIEHYKEIKEFYKMIINKNLEQIILKKV
jgi:hypothetical protein